MQSPARAAAAREANESGSSIASQRGKESDLGFAGDVSRAAVECTCSAMRVEASAARTAGWRASRAESGACSSPEECVTCVKVMCDASTDGARGLASIWRGTLMNQRRFGDLRLWQLTHPDRKQPEVWPGVESHAPLVAILCAGEHVRQSEHAGRVTRNGAIITCSSVETAAARARDNIPTRVAGVGAPAACRAAEW